MDDWRRWEAGFREFLSGQEESDPAHDLPHVERVVANAVKIGTVEGADLGVLFPAAWLHDCVHVAKDSPDRSRASLLAADRAVEFLRERQYPERYLEGIHHAIVAHSFSAGVAPQTLEAEVLQDADRLDALGAVGLSRMLMLGGFMQKSLFSPRDPFCRERAPDDGRYVIDHLFAKLFKLADLMHTDAGRAMAVERTAFLEEYVRQLEGELAGSIEKALQSRGGEK